MTTQKVDRTHIRNLYHATCEWDHEQAEIILTFCGMRNNETNPLRRQEVVVHLRMWFLPFLVAALKTAWAKAKKELDDFDAEVSCGANKILRW